jgi:hypothetical protein
VLILGLLSPWIARAADRPPFFIPSRIPGDELSPSTLRAFRTSRTLLGATLPTGRLSNAPGALNQSGFGPSVVTPTWTWRSIDFSALGPPEIRHPAAQPKGPGDPLIEV